MVDRRGLLAGAAATALSGCGVSEGDDEPGGAPADRSTTSREGDIELLRAAAVSEAAAAAAYGDHPFARIERAHLDRINRARDRLGDRGDSGFTAEAERDPQAIEGDAIAFYLDLLPKLYDPELRTLIASILVVEAEQLAELRAAEGRDPAPDAFVYGFKA